MQTMLVISMVLVALYVGATIYHTKKMPESVSAMVYAFPFKWLWTIWLWLVTFMIAPSLIETLGETVKFIGFLTIASLVFCGAMPLFDKENNLLHYIFGLSAGILSQVCVALISPWWLTLWFSYVLLTAGIWRWTEGKGVFFMECICYLSLVGALSSHSARRSFATATSAMMTIDREDEPLWTHPFLSGDVSKPRTSCGTGLSDAHALDFGTASPYLYSNN